MARLKVSTTINSSSFTGMYEVININGTALSGLLELSQKFKVLGNRCISLHVLMYL